MAKNYEVLLASDAKGQNFNINAYNVENGQCVTSFKGSTSAPGTLCVIQNEQIISAIPSKAVIQVYDLNKKSQQSIKIILPGVIKVLCVSHDGSLLAAGIAEKVLVWELAGGELLAILSRHYQTVTCLDFSHDDGYLASSGEDGIVSVWDLSDVWDRQTQGSQSVEAYHSWTSHTLPVTAVKFGSRFRLYTSSLDHAIKIHDTPSKQTIATIPLDSAVTSLTLSPSECSLYAGGANGYLFKVSLMHCGQNYGDHHMSNDSKQSVIAHDKSVSCLCVSLDGSFIISGSEDGKVKVWDRDSFQCVRTIKLSGAVTNLILFLSTPFFNSTNSKPSRVFQKLSHQVLSSNDKPGKKYLKLTSNSDEDRESDNSRALIEELCLKKAQKLEPSENVATLMAERDELRKQNEKLYHFAINHVLKNSS